MELTNDEKISILNQHIKNIVINKYNLQVAIIAEEASNPADQGKIDVLNAKIASEQAKYDALLVELETLQA
jgi:hypothetical protein